MEPPIPPDSTLSTSTLAVTPSKSVSMFLDDVASGTPTPGGGSVSAFAGTLAAGLAAMVARLTLGRKKYAEVEAEIQPALAAAESLRAKLLKAVDEDAAAYAAVLTANKIDKT